MSENKGQERPMAVEVILAEQQKPVVNFINLIKITEIKDVDYVIQLHNTYSGDVYVFKMYKALFKQAEEVRKIVPLKPIVGSVAELVGKIEEEDKKGNECQDIYM